MAEAGASEGGFGVRKGAAVRGMTIWGGEEEAGLASVRGAGGGGGGSGSTGDPTGCARNTCPHPRLGQRIFLPANSACTLNLVSQCGHCTIMDTVAPVTESTAQIETLKYRPRPGTQTTAPRDWLSFLMI
jgi:hypothetical protein